MADLLIPEGAELVGKTIAESGLRESDIVVLNLHRGTSVISNPKGTRVLEAGDKLLCYGKLDSMRSMVPERRTSQRKKVRTLDHDDHPDQWLLARARSAPRVRLYDGDHRSRARQEDEPRRG